MAQGNYTAADFSGVRQAGRASRYARFELTDKFLGYFEKEDITSLPAGALVVGSQNVVSNTDGTFGNRKGYSLYGAGSTSFNPIRSAYDFKNAAAYEAHLRAGNTVLEYLYNGTWYTLLSGLTDAQCYFEYTLFFDITNQLTTTVFVNKQSQIQEWNGAVAAIASNTATTLTKSGTITWAEAGFNSASKKTLTINGTNYTYTGGETTTTLTGLVALPAFTVGIPVTQAVVTTLNSSFTGTAGFIPPATFKNTHVGSYGNQLYISAYNSATIYLSSQDSYSTYTSAAVRVAGNAASFTFNTVNPIFVLQEDTMYISVGTDAWYKAVFTEQATSTIQTEIFRVLPVQSSLGQGALNNGSVFKVKNNIFLLNNEVALNSFGRVINNFATPQFSNYSDPVKNLFERLDFTNASGIYFRYNIYIAVPNDSVTLIYNIAKNYWEAPQTIPVSCFSIINGELYGHSNSTSETYKLFDTYSDIGLPMDVRAYFAFNHFGSRSAAKFFNEYYSEGYMTANATLNVGWNYETAGCQSTVTGSISGTDKQVCVGVDDSSPGKVPLGQNPLGGTIKTVYTMPKFRKIYTGVRKDFYEMQPFFTSFGKDFGWTVLAFGPQIGTPGYQDVSIKS